MNTNKNKIVYMAELAILVALIILMSFTPIGYLHVGAIEITFITIPVIVGAVVMGPLAGAILGGVFGLTSFIQCFGMSLFGTTLFGINPILTAILCLVPRILMGLLTGFIFKAFKKKSIVSFIVPSISGALLNTVLFMLGLVAMFWWNADFISTMASWGFDMNFIPAFLIAFVGVNGAIEAGVCAVAGTAVAKAVYVLNTKKFN